MKACMVVALTSLLLTPSIASAQGAPSLKPFEIGVGGGISTPVGRAKDAYKTGWHATGVLRLHIPMLPFGLNGSFSYHHFPLTQAAGSGSGRILAGVANAMFSSPLPGPLKPYFLAGVGTYNSKANPDTPGPASQSTTKFGIDAGAGATISLPGVHGFVEARIENIFSDPQTRIVPVTVGILF
jgi:opacity protein-like surface antigen